MAMKTASPWWFSALFFVGMLAIGLGERPFDHIASVRLILTGGGALMIFGITALRSWTMMATKGDRRAVERMLLMTQVGVLIGLGLYITTTEWGRGLVGAGDLEGETLERYMVPMTVISTIVVWISLLVMLMIELSLGVARRSDFNPRLMATSDVDQEAVESFRVRDMANSGLTIGLAAAFLLVTCNIAQQRNIRRDVSYFKTSAPGASTINIVKSVSEPVKVYLFFPDINQVKNEVRAYFDTLAEDAGGVIIEEHDVVLDASLVKQLKVSDNGTVVIEYAGKTEKMTFTWDPEKARKSKARNELRELDRKVNSALMAVVKEKRTAYLTVGHGELNDADSDWLKGGLRATEFKRRLKELNFDVKDLSPATGLGTEIPDDASLVVILGPKLTFMDEEMGSIERFLDRGGRLLVALDPLSDAGLGVLEERFGVKFDNTAIVDSGNNYLPGRQPSPADRRFIKTNRLSAHAALTTLSRASARYGVAFMETGSFIHLDIDAERKGKITRLPIIRSMTTSFKDVNKNLSFDAGIDTREQHNLVMSIEEPGTVPEGSEGHEGMRALLFGDVHTFTDPFQTRMPSAIVLLDDALRWLGGEEHLAGEIVSEKDVVLAHTRNEDEVWFYSTIVGAPLLVLGFGLWFGWWRRQRIQRRAS